MVTVAQLVDAADLKDNSKAKVKTALAQLGYDQGEEVGEAFRKLTCDQLQRDGGLNVREANAVLAQITPASGGQSVGYVRSEDFESLTLKVLELTITLNKSQQTSQSEQEIGEAHSKLMKTECDFPWLVPVSEDDERLVKAQDAVLSAFGPRQPAGKMFGRSTGKRMRIDEEHEQAGEEQIQAGVAGQISTSALPPESRLPGHSLMDLIGHDGKLTEEQHMQPAVMTLLRAAATALCSSTHLEDTHKASNRLSNPYSQPDVTCLADAGTPSWARVVWTGEFKLSDTQPDIMRAIGQEITRTKATFEGQDDQRQLAMALILTLNSLELLSIRKGSLGLFVVSSTGQLPFSVSLQSLGFRWLVRLLLTPRDQLGYLETALPRLSNLGQVSVGGLQLIRRARKSGSGSFVWSCQASGSKAVLKLNEDSREGVLLEKLQGVPHVIQLLARGTCSYLGRNWHAVLVQPFVTLLSHEDSLQLVGQVAADVAQGIHGCAQHGIAQRDTTERNMGFDQAGRGFLMDFSAGKFVEGSDWSTGIAPDSPQGRDVRHITGTLTAAPLSVLRGEPHSVSSMLEGVFLSVLSIACKGRIAGYELTTDNLKTWEYTRAGALQLLELPEEEKIVKHLKPLVHSLHDLFYPMPVDGSKTRRYCTTVTVPAFRAACQSACNNELRS